MKGSDLRSHRQQRGIRAEAMCGLLGMAFEGLVALEASSNVGPEIVADYARALQGQGQPRLPTYRGGDWSHSRSRTILHA